MDDFATLKEPRARGPKPAITAEEMERRRAAVRWADANNRLEGIFRDPTTNETVEAFVQGRIELPELVRRMKDLPHPR